MKDREPNIPRRQVSQEAVDALNPKYRARFDAEAAALQSAVDQAQSPLARQLGHALAESFAAGNAELFGTLQQRDDQRASEMRDLTSRVRRRDGRR
jgi:hypothetical protein